MDLLTNVNLVQLGFVGLMAFGSVGAVTFFYKTLTAGQKFLLLAAFAFVYGFVPADFGNVIAERVKEAIAVATSITALYTGIKSVGGK
jgi:hypothetical protein